MPFVDSHCHIAGPEYDADRDEVITRARDAGVMTMLNVGTGDPQRNITTSTPRLACILTMRNCSMTGPKNACRIWWRRAGA